VKASCEARESAHLAKLSSLRRHRLRKRFASRKLELEPREIRIGLAPVELRITKVEISERASGCDVGQRIRFAVAPGFFTELPGEFRDAFDDLSHLFREHTDERVRLAALEALADLASPEVGTLLIETVMRETGALQAAAEARLRTFNSDDLIPAIRQAMDLAGGEAPPALRRIWSSLGA